MKSLFAIVMTCLICAAMWAGGNFALVASWLLVFFGINGIVIGLLYDYKVEHGEELRKVLRERNMVVFTITELSII